MIEAALRRALLAASRSRWLGERLTSVPGVRRGVRRFMPGETVEEALEAAREVALLPGVPVLTLLGEDVEDASEAETVTGHYRTLLGRGSRPKVEISVKPTQLGLDVDPEGTRGRLLSLAEACREAGSWLWIDMESSRRVDPTLALLAAAREGGGRVGVCLQAYLRRTPADLEAILGEEGGVGIRLVKGAYAEPADRALPAGRAVDRAYRELGERLLGAAREGRVRAVLGTHDDRLIDALRPAAGAAGVPLEVHVLYGIRAALQKRLAGAGDVRLGVLVSYGPAWYPWYLRRLAERPANLAFALRQLL